MKQVIILLLFASNLHPILAQSHQEISEMRKLMPNKVQQEPAYRDYSRNNKSEYQVLASGLFLFYKSFISSQDGNRCSFHPSCSSYALQIIKKKGWFIGAIASFDRLTRCNSLSPEWYEKDFKRKLLIDRP